MGTQEAILPKTFTEFGGNDYRANDVNRKERYARNSVNVECLKNNSLTVRPGNKTIASGKGGGGFHKYVYKDSSIRSQELPVTIDSELYKKTTGSFTVQYTGAGVSAVFRISAVLSGSTYTYQAEVEVDGVSSGTLDLGSGKDDAAPVTIAALRTWVDSLTDITVGAISGSSTEPATTIPCQEVPINSAATIEWFYWVKVYCPLSTPFSEFWATVNTANFENASMLNLIDCLYIATGYGALYKFDAVSLFKAGMPAATALALGARIAGALTGAYEWFITYEQVDARGNVVEGDESNVVSFTLAAQQQALTIPQIQTSTGFLTSYAQVNGGQAGVTTITVDAGHTLQVGQTAYFANSVGAMQERLITAIGATSITIAGAVVTVLDNEPISANLRINLWRNIAGSTELFYLVKTFANNSSVATISYSDNTADANLGAEYIPPEIGHGLPPEDLRYITAFQNLIVGADGTDIIRRSDVDGPEYWVEDVTRFVIRSKKGGVVTAIGATKELLAVFKKEESHVLSGSLGDDRFRLDLLGGAIGCDSFASVIAIDTELWFYSGSHGMHRIVGSGEPEELSYRVLPAITSPPALAGDSFIHKRVVAVNVESLQVALFFLPVESSNVATVDSKVFVADYREKAQVDSEYDEQGRTVVSRPRVRWFLWDGIDMSGGAISFEESFLFMSRHLNSSTASMEYLTSKRQETSSAEDFTDYAQPYEFEYETSWYHLDAPKQLKNWVRAAILSLPLGGASSFMVTCSTEINFINDRSHSVKEISFGDGGVSAGWGNWSWGSVAWGEAVSVNKNFPFKPTKATALKLRFDATIWKTQPVISGWVVEVVPAFKPHVRD